MDTQEIERLIVAGLPGSQAIVRGDGRHFEAIVVSPAFEGKTMLQEQRMVYATLDELMSNGRLHALSIRAYTPAEWQQAQSLRVF